MKQFEMVRRRLFDLAAALILAALVPGVASAVPISLSGSVDNVQALLGGSPFAVGDSLSGSFDVNVGSDNSFNAGDLSDFSLTVGPAVFDLDSSDFGTFSGQLSGDGSMLTDFAVVSDFVSVPNLDGTFALGFNGLNQPFSVNAGTSIASGAFNATVGAGQVDVPEPSPFALFALATLVMGSVLRRRQRGLRSCTAFGA